MKLYEFEGHRLLEKAGVASPFFVVCKSYDEVLAAKSKLKFPVVAKVQVLSGKRGKHGGVVVVNRAKGLEDFAKEYFGEKFPKGDEGGEVVKYIVLAQKVDFEKEFYISFGYDTVEKKPYVLFSEKGGMDIEEISKDDFLKVFIDPTAGPTKGDLRRIPVPYELVCKIWKAFVDCDARLIEINPLSKVDGSFMALDAKVILDDNGLVRHQDLDVIPKGAISAEPTKREISAKKIDADDYRGSAGSAFIELEGDIAILASGGGASLLVMDALEAAGGKAANYTEYSGNPSREKVEKLTRLVLSKKGLKGCLVCGAVANFTDIFETLSGFVDGLKKVEPKPTYPIVIRRGGPRVEEAYKMLETLAKKEGFDIHLFGAETPISVAARKMVELSGNYKNGGKK